MKNNEIFTSIVTGLLVVSILIIISLGSYITKQNTKIGYLEEDLDKFRLEQMPRRF
jgi:hypothetical protein